MAKENKSTTILLLVIAGVLLFLVGSYTGNLTLNKGTTKQEVLKMLNSCELKTCSTSSLIGPIINSCDEVCKPINKVCTLAMINLNVGGSLLQIAKM